MIVQKNTIDINDDSGDSFVGDLIAKLKQKNRLNIVKWEPAKNEYPQYMLLSGDKGILAYINFYIMRNQEDKAFIHDYCDLIRRLSLAISDLDRPVFNVYCQTYLEENNICFETYEQIRDIIYNDTARIKKDENGKKIFESHKSEMGFENELISIFYDMKKNGVKIS